MKIVYFGGGSFRILGDLRNIAGLSSMRNGEIALYDHDRARVQAMAAISRQAPEIRQSGTRISTPETLDQALDGADFVMALACPWNWELHAKGCHTCREMGFMGSDNLSLEGAFLALKGVPMVLDLAREMEKRAPKATMIVFTNPIAILAGAVNRYTSIRAIGVCAGITNYIHNIAYMMGWSDYNWDFTSEAAGINHFSWIMQLTLNGEDFLPLLDRKINAGIDWAPLKKIANYDWLATSFPREWYIWKTFGRMIASAEGDGYPHLCFYEDEIERCKQQAKLAPQAIRGTRAGHLQEFIELSGSKITDSAWEGTDYELSQGLRPFPRSALVKPHWKSCATFRVLKGLTTDTPETVEVSYFNRGAIKDFPAGAIMEYPAVFSSKGMDRKNVYTLPPGAVGVTQSIVEHQTLIAEAVAEKNRGKFLLGIYAYPMCKSRKKAETFLEKMIEARREEIPDFIRS